MLHFLKHKNIFDKNHSFNESRMIFKAAPGVPDVAPAGGAEKAWYYTKKVGRGVWSPLRVPVKGMYYASGGGLLGYGFNLTKRGLSAVGDGAEFAGNKVNEGGNYLGGMTKEALGGAWESTATASWSMAKAFPRDMKMNFWDVGKESLKTQWQIAKSPLHFLQGTKQAADGLFGKSLGIAKNLATLNIRSAVNDTFNLYPIDLFKKSLSLDFRGMRNITRPLVRNIMAPVYNPVMPVLDGVYNTAKMGVASKTQYITSMRESANHVWNGGARIWNSPASGSTAAEVYRNDIEQKKLKIAAEEAALEAGPANSAPPAKAA